jgi:poly(A) polymerase
MGMKPGPRFREILDAVETQQLEGELSDRAEALAWVEKKYPLGET